MLNDNLPATTQTPVKETSDRRQSTMPCIAPFAFIRPGVSKSAKCVAARTIGGLIPDAPSLSSQFSQRFSILLGEFSFKLQEDRVNFLASLAVGVSCLIGTFRCFKNPPRDFGSAYISILSGLIVESKTAHAPPRALH